MPAERCRTRTADAAWLAERHLHWPGLRSIAAIIATRTDKKTGETLTETRLYISSLLPDPALILAACRSHWSIENNLHWQLDVTFREDQMPNPQGPCGDQSGHDAPPASRPRSIPIKRKRLKAAINPEFRAALLAR